MICQIPAAAHADFQHMKSVNSPEILAAGIVCGGLETPVLQLGEGNRGVCSVNFGLSV